MKKNNSKHEFSLYWPDTNIWCLRTNIPICDKNLVARITKILRLRVGDIFVIFDEYCHLRVVIHSIEPHKVAVKVIAGPTGQLLRPAITFYLPLLKKTALEAAVYGLTEVGVNTIQLVQTDNVQRKWGGQKEHDRLQKIIIAAAEQAKQYVIPTIQEPVLFNDITFEDPIFVGNPEGAVMGDIVGVLKKKYPKKIGIIVGPEADLSVSEIERLKELKAHFYKLTRSVLRAQQAAVLSVGIINSMVRVK